MWVLAVLGCGQRSSPAQGVDAGAIEVAPAPPEKGDGTNQRLNSRFEVPLLGPRVEATTGDWMLTSGNQVAVVSSKHGRLVDFGTSGSEDALVYVEPTVFVGLDEATSVVEGVDAAGPGG